MTNAKHMIGRTIEGLKDMRVDANRDLLSRLENWVQKILRI